MAETTPQMTAPVSVLMAVYKDDNPIWFREALLSIFNQTLPCDELVVVVDGPVGPELDEEIDRAAKIDTPTRLVVERLPENRGLGEALNAGLAVCSNDVVARMDADDLCTPDRFEKQWALFETLPDITLLGTLQAEFEDDPDHINAYKLSPEFHDDIVAKLKWRCVVPHPSIMFRKAPVIEIGGYAPYRRQDHDLFLRLIHQGHRLQVMQEALIKVRVIPEQRKRRSGLKLFKEFCQFRYRVWKRGDDTFLFFVFITALWGGFILVPSGLKSFLYRIVRKPADAKNE